MRKEYISSFALCLLALACTSDIPSEDAQPMELTMTRSDDTVNAEDAPILIFWKESELVDLGTIGKAPYNVFVPGQSISTFATVPCNTQENYPEDDSFVRAFGISPSSMTTPTTPPLSADSYTKYTLPSGKEGITDVMASSGISGNKKWPFSQAMEFRHLTTRIILKAQRTENTRDNMFIRKLKLTIPKEKVCSGMVWNASAEEYKALAASADVTALYAEQLRIDEPQVIGTFYLILAAPSDFTGFKIEAELAKDVAFTEGKRTASFEIITANIEFKDNSGNPVSTFNPGESYETILKFDIDTFTFEGEQEKWENGGKVTIPVIIPSNTTP